MPTTNYAKQSQFAGGKIHAMSVFTKDYGDFTALRLRKNKAKKSQIQNPATEQKSVMKKGAGNWQGALKKNFQKNW